MAKVYQVLCLLAIMLVTGSFAAAMPVYDFTNVAISGKHLGHNETARVIDANTGGYVDNLLAANRPASSQQVPETPDDASPAVHLQVLRDAIVPLGTGLRVPGPTHLTSRRIPSATLPSSLLLGDAQQQPCHRKELNIRIHIAGHRYKVVDVGQCEGLCPGSTRLQSMRAIRKAGKPLYLKAKYKKSCRCCMAKAEDTEVELTADDGSKGQTIVISVIAQCRCQRPCKKSH